MRYDDWGWQVFDCHLPTTVQDTKLYAAFPPGSPWHQKCFEAILLVEREYVETLLAELRDRKTEGDIVEFGIFQGAWIDLLYRATERIGFPREIWGFDSFQGLSRPDPNYDGAYWREGMYSASLAEVSERVKAAERRRIKLVKGFFSDSLRTSQAQALGKVCYARIDCDLYEPARECLDFLSNRLTDGSILVFDDWTHDIERGEARAFAEWIPSVPHLKFEFMFLGPWDHFYLRVRHR